MKIPKRLKVGGKVYTVLFPHTFTERSDVAGLTCPGTLIIRVSGVVSATGEKKSREAIEETFLHELLHAVDHAYNAGALDEPTIVRLSEGLYQVLKDNGLLAEGRA